MNANIKYLKDEDGNIISPVTSGNSVYINDKQLTDTIKLNPIFYGDVGNVNSLTMTDNYTNYSFIVVYGVWDNVARHAGSVILQPSVSLYQTLRISWSQNNVQFQYEANLQLYDKNKLKITNGFGQTIDNNGNTTGIFCNGNQINIRSIFGIL